MTIKRKKKLYNSIYFSIVLISNTIVNFYFSSF